VEGLEAAEPFRDTLRGERRRADQSFERGGRLGTRTVSARPDPSPPSTDEGEEPCAAEAEQEEHSVAGQHLLDPSRRQAPRGADLLGGVREPGDHGQPHDRAEREPRAAEDDGNEELKREHRPVCGWVRDCRELDAERSGQTGDRRRGRHGAEPEPGDRHAEAEGCFDVIPARGKRDAGAAAREDREREECEREQREPDRVVDGRRELLSEHARLRHHEALGAAGDARERRQREQDDPAENPGADGDERAAQPAGRESGQDAAGTGDEHGEQERRQQGHAALRARDRLGKGADPEERALPERGDPGEPDCVPQPHRGEREVDEAGEIDQPALRKHGGGEQGCREQQGPEGRRPAPARAELPRRCDERASRLAEHHRSDAHARPGTGSERSDR
jgi:hypothetical protein